MDFLTLNLVFLTSTLTISAQEHSCISHMDVQEDTYDDGTSGLKIRRNLSRSSSYYTSPTAVDLPIDILSFHKGCNLILRSFKLLVLSQCRSSVILSESDQVSTETNSTIAFIGTLSCSGTGKPCWRDETSKNLPKWNVAGKYVVFRILPGGPCTLIYTKSPATQTGWYGVTLFTTDVDECTSATHNCIAGAACENTIGGYKCARNFSIVNSTARKPATTPSEPNSETDYAQLSIRHASISHHVTSFITSHPNNTQDLPSTGVLSKTMSEIARSTTSSDRFPDTPLLDDSSSSPSVITRSGNVTESGVPVSDGIGSGNASQGTTVIVASIISTGLILVFGIVLVIYVKYPKRRLLEISGVTTRQDYAHSFQMKSRKNDQKLADSRTRIPLKEDSVQVKKEETPNSTKPIATVTFSGMSDDHSTTRLPDDYQFRNDDVTYAYAYTPYCSGHQTNLAYPSDNPDTAYEVVDTQNASYKDRNQTETEASFVGTVNPAYGIHGQAC